jgi:hypothetical protein
MGADAISSFTNSEPAEDDQSCTNSAIMVFVVVSQTPFRSILRRDISSAISKGDPEASITACTSYPPRTALMLGKTRQMSVVTPPITNIPRHVVKENPDFHLTFPGV